MTNLSLKKQLLKGWIGSLFVKAGFALLSFLISVVLARALGADGFGIYSFVIAVIMLLSIPAVVGVPELIVRETAKNQVDEQWSVIKGLWTWTQTRSIVFSLILVFFSSLMTLFWGVGDESLRVNLLLVGLFIIPFSAIIAYKSACVRGLGHTVLGQLPDNIIRPGLILISILLFSFVSRPFTPETAIFVYLFAAMVAAISAYILLNKVSPKELSNVVKEKDDSLLWSKAILPLSLIGGLHVLNGYVDIVILAFFQPDEEVGIYRAVVQLSILVSFGLQAINQVLHPHFSRLFMMNEHHKLQKLVTISTRIILLISLPPVLLFVFYGKGILQFVFGDPFYIGELALAVLAIGQLINSAMGSVGALLNMTGHERYTLRGVFLAALLNVVLNFILIPFYGMLGAAIATAVSLALWNLLLRHYVRQKLNIEPSALFKPQS